MSVALPGRWLDPAGVERDCTLVGDAIDALEVRTGSAPPKGARVVCRIPELGMLRGLVRGPSPGGFQLAVQGGEEARRRLSARLRWHGTGVAHPIDRRGAERIVPSRPDVVVVWDGASIPAKLRDVSEAGAAIELSPLPPVGASITVGRRRARVVRSIEAAVGVAFSLPLNPADVTEDIIL